MDRQSRPCDLQAGVLQEVQDTVSAQSDALRNRHASADVGVAKQGALVSSVEAGVHETQKMCVCLHNACKQYTHHSYFIGCDR